MNCEALPYLPPLVFSHNMPNPAACFEFITTSRPTVMPGASVSTLELAGSAVFKEA